MAGEIAGGQQDARNRPANVNRRSQPFERANLYSVVLPGTHPAKPAPIPSFPDREFLALLEMVPQHRFQPPPVRMPCSEVISTRQVGLHGHVMPEVDDDALLRIRSDLLQL